MLVKTEAIVLSSIKYRDADLIVKCYTKALGNVSFMVKGVLKSKKGKFRSAMFQAFSLIDIEMQYRQKGQLEYFKDIQISNHLNNIQSNVYKSALVMFLAEILKSVIVEEEQNDRLFDFIKGNILHLETSTRYANFHLSFLLNLSSFLGFYPHKPEHNNEVYFNLSEGHFEPVESLYSLNLEHSMILKNLLGMKSSDMENINLSKTQRRDMLNFLLSFYELHIENFKTPKSLEVFESIFS
mgnify:CR=1 FL=1